MAEGRLYLVATPIGNLEDITLRALRVLREVDLIAAEDTRHTRKLLNHYQISTPLTSYHQHNEAGKAQDLITQLQSGLQLALVSDAGLPGISDPGVHLVAAAVECGIPITPIPGASASLTALVASGLSTEAFCFWGFLPRKGKEREALFEALVSETKTSIFYESPNRLVKTLVDLKGVLGNRVAVVARELTKLHEEFARGSLGELVEYYQEHPPKGEITLILGGASPTLPQAIPPQEYPQMVAQGIQGGLSKKEAIRAVAQAAGVSRRDVYQSLLED